MTNNVQTVSQCTDPRKGKHVTVQYPPMQEVSLAQLPYNNLSVNPPASQDHENSGRLGLQPLFGSKTEQLYTKKCQTAEKKFLQPSSFEMPNMPYLAFWHVANLARSSDEKNTKR